MSTEIDELTARITNDPELRVAHEIVGELENAGRTADLVALFRRLTERRDAADGAAQKTRDAAADVVIEALALSPRPDRVEALLTLITGAAASREHPRDGIVRGVASRLGYGQPKGSLLTALSAKAGDAARAELLACWTHELVLSGTALDREPAAKAFHERLVASGHPLAPFPLHLLESEREAPTYMPMYGADAIQKAVRTLESGPSSVRTIPPPADHDAPRVSLVADAALEARMREAVAPWTEGSKGKAETRVFALTPPVAEVGRWLLRALPLESTRDGTLDIARVTPDVAWGALFGAASNGGAYSTGLGGAYGRRAAWASFAALLGAPAPARREDVERLDHEAASATFLMYRGTSFFFDVAWDIGVAVVRPDGASVAVLAATDTD